MDSGNANQASTLAPAPITIELKVRIQAIALPEADGGYSIVVPALPGCVSEADTLEDIQAQIAESAEGWLAASHDRAREDAIRTLRGE